MELRQQTERREYLQSHFTGLHLMMAEKLEKYLQALRGRLRAFFLCSFCICMRIAFSHFFIFLDLPLNVFSHFFPCPPSPSLAPFYMHFRNVVRFFCRCSSLWDAELQCSVRLRHHQDIFLHNYIYFLHINSQDSIDCEQHREEGKKA